MIYKHERRYEDLMQCLEKYNQIVKTLVEVVLLFYSLLVTIPVLVHVPVLAVPPC
jgi:hypothetical protein